MAFHSLNIGTSALLTARYGLDITGQNLGNIDTPGYSRQILTQNATNSWNAGLNNAVMGTGVWVKTVHRVANEHIEKQLRQATSSDAYYGSLQSCYSNIQTFFNELTGNALSDAMNSFWDSMNDFSANVENIPTRVTVLKEAESMVSRFNRLGEQLTRERIAVNEQVEESIGNINNLLTQIAQLNRNIVNTELGGFNGLMANDLRDQRGEAIKELYSYMDIDVVEEKNGSSIISLHGRTLVYFDQVHEIQTEQVLSDDMQVVNPVFGDDRYPLQPGDGQLAAQMELRDEIIKGYKDDLDSLAGKFIWEFNRAYSQGRGLESFAKITSLTAPLNPADTLDKLRYGDKIPAGTFQIVNGNFEIVIQNRNNPGLDQTVNIHVDLDGREPPDGDPDMILWDPDDPGASHSLINRMQTALDEALPGVFKVTIDNQFHVSIESAGEDYGFAFGNDTSGVLAALGINVLFTGHNSLSMGVNQSLFESPALMAGARSFSAGDNAGVNALLAVRDAKVFAAAGMTLDEFYQSMTGRLGSEFNRTNDLKYMHEDILQQMFVQRESLSGVNEEEETAKLIAYQRAFQSAAKFISTVDVLYETLLNM